MLPSVPFLISEPRSSVSCVAIPSMTDTLICVSARLPHPLQPNVYVQMWWQEAKHPSVRGAGIPSPSTVTPVISAAMVPATQGTSACASPKRDSQGWSSSSHDDDHNSSRRVPTPWVSSSSPTSSSASGRSCADPRQLAYHQAFSHPLLMPTARLPAFVQSTLPCGSALMRPFRPTAKMIGTGVTHGEPNSLARQAVTPLSFLTFSLIEDRLSNSWISRSVGLLVLLFIQISAADVRLTSSRSSPGILDLHEVLMRVYWLRTLMAIGM